METHSHSHKVSLGNLISALFLVAGTCIGGGMLALPVATGISGFMPSTLMMLTCWLAMTLSALFLLEANLWLRSGAHVISMASAILGPVGKIVSWCVFLFISYASLVAYTSGGSSLILHIFKSVLGVDLSPTLACLLFIFIFGGITYLGSYVLGRINAILFVGMIVAYCALVITGIPEIKLTLLTHKKWAPAFLAIPLLLTTFSFQTMMPSLTPYLKRNVKALRIAIIGGTTLTLLIYLIWEGLVLGIVPLLGPNSLMEALEAGAPITNYLREHVKSDYVSTIAEYFAFFALVTSFLGIALGLFDFLADGLKIKKAGWGHLILGILIVVPTFIFANYFERIFLVALDTSGGYGDTILNGIIPVLMVWIGRYHLKFPDTHRTPGGKPLLVIVFLFFVFSLIFKIMLDLGYSDMMLGYFSSHEL